MAKPKLQCSYGIKWCICTRARYKAFAFQQLVQSTQSHSCLSAALGAVAAFGECATALRKAMSRCGRVFRYLPRIPQGSLREKEERNKKKKNKSTEPAKYRELSKKKKKKKRVGAGFFHAQRGWKSLWSDSKHFEIVSVWISLRMAY